MKKILSLLGTITLIGTSTTSLFACENILTATDKAFINKHLMISLFFERNYKKLDTCKQKKLMNIIWN